jgi:hypothetical protein
MNPISLSGPERSGGLRSPAPWRSNRLSIVLGPVAAGGSIVLLALREPAFFPPLGTLAVGSAWGLLVGLAVFLFADKFAEVRGWRPNPLTSAACTAALAGAVAWTTAGALLGMMYANC